MTAVVMAALGALLLAPVASRAQIACGDTIGRGEKVALTENLGPCDGVVAAITVDGGTLDLGGFSINCADTNLDGELALGVLLTGKKSKLSNGLVDRCASGVTLGGSGQHRVERVTAQSSRDDGFEVLPEAARTKLVGVLASLNAGDGIRLRSDRSKVLDASALHNATNGIALSSSAERNKVVRAELLRNGAAGVLIEGARNKLVARRRVREPERRRHRSRRRRQQGEPRHHAGQRGLRPGELRGRHGEAPRLHDRHARLRVTAGPLSVAATRVR